MNKLLLIREIYLEAFKDLGHFLVKAYFRAFSWFCVAAFLVVLYAFIFRIATGFVFD
ncbi:MAG: DUF6747 family protein [Bacteroidota bacterium]